MRLNPKALGLACGVAWSAGLTLAGIWVMLMGGGEHLALLGRFYLGYSLTVPGLLAGLVWGFVDGFICGWVVAWLYNQFAGGGAPADAQTKS